MPLNQYNIPSKLMTLSHPLTNTPPITLADTPKTFAYSKIMATGVLNIAYYIKIIVAHTAIIADVMLNIACYNKIIVAHTATIADVMLNIACGSKIIACGSKNIACNTKIIACSKQNIASRTQIIDNYIASNLSALAPIAANTSKTSPVL